MSIFRVDDVASDLARAGSRYREFLRAATLSAGVYRLPAGGQDEQQPHGEDEVYYVIGGRARLRIGSADHAVAPGSVAFVRAREVHRFHDIAEDLTLLVFFAPPEGAAPAGQRS